MFQFLRTNTLALALLAATTCALAPPPRSRRPEDTVLFNGNNLKGWTFKPADDEKNPKSAEQVWLVQHGVLVSTGTTTGFLTHEGQFENYVLTLDWRSMPRASGGAGSKLAASGAGALFIHTSDEKGSFGCPKSIEIGLFNDPGSVYFRDVEPFAQQQWAFRAPDFAGEFEKPMGEWNELKVICHDNRLTVFLNGTPINQVDGLNRTKGSIALQSQTASFKAPSYYRNIKLQPISDAAAQEEKAATAQLAKLADLAIQKKAAAAARELEKQLEAKKLAEQLEAKRRAEELEAKKLAEELEAKRRAEELARQFPPIKVTQQIEFTTDVRKLPFPKDARDLEFEVTFGDVKLVSNSSLDDLVLFYRTEMAKRGWQETEKERDDDSVDVTFKHGEAEIELTLEQDSKGVEISLDTDGLSFEGTNDPAQLIALGLPQPKAYVFLQKEIKLPANVRDLEFTDGNRCLFKSDLTLQQAFDNLGAQLKAKQFRESRRPIVTADRRYTEFTKGRVEVSVNVFTHERGSRAILEYEEK